MRKATLFLLILVITISGCGAKTLSEMPSELEFNNTHYAKHAIIVGDQIAPGNLTIDVKKNQGKTMSIMYDDGTDIYFYSNQEQSFKKCEKAKEDSLILDYFRQANVFEVTDGTSISLPQTIKDNQTIVVSTFPQVICGMGRNDDILLNDSDIVVSSDASESYDDSWAATKGKQKQSFIIDGNTNIDTLAQSQGQDYDDQYLEIGQDLVAGYMQITCEESETGTCGIGAIVTKFDEGNKVYEYQLDIPTPMEVGGSYIIPIPLINGMGISFSALSVYETDKDLNQKIIVEMLTELPQQEENPEDSNN